MVDWARQARQQQEDGMPTTQPDESAADLIARGNAAMGQEYRFALGIPFI
jgi:hypothetical protein